MFKIRFYFYLIYFLFSSQIVFGQNTYQAYVVDKNSKNPLIGANVVFDSLGIGGATDMNGLVKVFNIPKGSYNINIMYIGYESIKIKRTFPPLYPEKIDTVLLNPTELMTDQIVVSATRNNGIVADTPIRVEVLGQEEVHEEIAIRPGNISKLLSETSGIQVQQTSALSGNVSFRLQGLPGNYTQLLKDGLPTFNGFSSGLSLLQIPPLDLQQVEVIKGSNSTLYGEGAVAGIVNLVSKEPSPQGEFSVILNQTQKKERDISSFYSNRQGNIGLTFLASQSAQDAVDVNKDGFTDLPNFSQVTLNPRLYYYFDEATSLMFGISSFFENREGGDIFAIEKGIDSSHTYFETNKTKRLSSQIEFNKKYRTNDVFTFKSTMYYFNRDVSFPASFFSGEQIYSYSEVSNSFNFSNHNLVLGFNFITDSFKQNDNSNLNIFDYRYYTFGFFAQDDWNLSPHFIIQPGFRLDYHNKFHTFIVPHLASLYKFNNNFFTRLSGGFGYNAPDTFAGILEEDAFQNKISSSPRLRAETSKSLNLDLNYRFFYDEFGFTLNQAFFITSLKNAVIPNLYQLYQNRELNSNSNLKIDTKGFDTNLILALDELILFLDYSYTDVRKSVNDFSSFLELTPKYKLNMTLTFEMENNWRTGIEAFYTGKQHLSNSALTRDYWTFGAMVEKFFKSFSIIGNVENVFDERQTKHESIFYLPITNPTFKPIYAPLDGFVANVALKINIK